MTEEVSGIRVFNDSNTASSEKTHEPVHSNTTECTNLIYMNDSGARSPTTSNPQQPLYRWTTQKNSRNV